MERAGRAACFFPWCRLNFVTYRWPILGAITSFPSCLAAAYCLERDRFFFFGFCTNGTLATSPVVADLCPGWGDERVSCPLSEQLRFASWQTKVSSGTWRNFLLLLHWHVASASHFKRVQDTGGFVPIVSLHSKHLENSWASAGTPTPFSTFGKPHTPVLLREAHGFSALHPGCISACRCPWKRPQVDMDSGCI